MIVCATVLSVTYLITKVGVTINMTYTNKDKPKDVLGAQDKDSAQNSNIDKVLAEIYDAFDINIDTGEDDK